MNSGENSGTTADSYCRVHSAQINVRVATYQIAPSLSETHRLLFGPEYCWESWFRNPRAHADGLARQESSGVRFVGSGA